MEYFVEKIKPAEKQLMAFMKKYDPEIVAQAKLALSKSMTTTSWLASSGLASHRKRWSYAVFSRRASIPVK